MSTLYIIYCDNCERSTPILPNGRVPEGWAQLLFCDLQHQFLCSYQCLFEHTKKMLDNPPTPHTPMWPVENPCPSLEGIQLDKVPERFRYNPEGAH